jgi:hypothetical protein
MATLGLQGIGSIQWGGKGTWKPTHVHLAGSTLRLRDTGFGADTTEAGIINIELLGTETRRPTTVRKGHPHAFRVNLSGADRLKHGITKVLCDLDDEAAVDQWIFSLNEAANPPAAQVPVPASAAPSGDGINGGLDEEAAALRAAVELSTRDAPAYVAAGQLVDTRGGGAFDSGDEDDTPLARRRPQQQPQQQPAPPLDIFGSVPYGAPQLQPEPEPEPAGIGGGGGAGGGGGLHDLFGTVPFGSEVQAHQQQQQQQQAPPSVLPPAPALAPAATLLDLAQAAPVAGGAGATQAAADPFGDLFGMAPFDANGSGGGGAATPAPAPAPAAIPPGRVQNLVDVFGSVPFSGAAGGAGSSPSEPSTGPGGTGTGGGGTQDLLHGW